MLANNNSNRGNMDTDERTVEEEYKIWKTNCPFLYDRIHSQVSTWPYLTVQWLPGAYGCVWVMHAESCVVSRTHQARSGRLCPFGICGNASMVYPRPGLHIALPHRAMAPRCLWVRVGRGHVHACLCGELCSVLEGLIRRVMKTLPLWHMWKCVGVCASPSCGSDAASLANVDRRLSQISLAVTMQRRQGAPHPWHADLR